MMMDEIKRKVDDMQHAYMRTFILKIWMEETNLESQELMGA